MTLWLEPKSSSQLGCVGAERLLVCLCDTFVSVTCFDALVAAVDVGGGPIGDCRP